MLKNKRRKLECEINRLLIFDNYDGRYSVYTPWGHCLLAGTCLAFAKSFPTTLPGISHIRYQKTVRNTCHSILSCQIRRSLLSENMLCAMHFIRTSAHIIKIWKISFLTGAVLDIPEQKQES